LSSLQPSRLRGFFFFLFFISSIQQSTLWSIPAMVIVNIFPSNVLRLHPQENPARHYAKKCRRHFAPSKGEKDLLTFFLSDEKESKQRKNRRHRFIGQFFLYTNGVNLNTLFTPCLLNYMAFSSSHPVLIQKPRRSPLRRGKLLLYVIAVNTLYL